MFVSGYSLSFPFDNLFYSILDVVATTRHKVQ